MVGETAAWLRARQAEIRSLQLTDQILARIESAAAAGGVQVPVALTEAVERLRQAIQSGEAEPMAEARDALLSELQLWRLLVSRLDARLSASALRRFCQRGDPPPDTPTLAALMRFYRSFSHISQSQSKYEVVATRLFTLRAEDERLRLRFSRQQIVTHLTRMSATWDEAALAECPEGAESAEAIGKFADFISQFNGLIRLEELLCGDLSDHLRQFKSSLGEAFYLPEITAAAIECNVVCVNKFLSLLALHGFHPVTATTRELIDTLSETSAHLITEEIQRVLAQADAAEKMQLERLLSLLRTASAATEALTAEATATVQPETEQKLAAESESATEAVSQPVGPETSVLEETLEQVESKDGNRVIVTMFRQSSVALQQLDLRMFLSSLALPSDSQVEAGALADARRHALTLLISVDHLLHPAAALEEEPEENRREKLSSLLAEIRQTIAGFQAMAEPAHWPQLPAIAEVLNYISDCLRQAQQNLQSASFNHGASRFAQRQTAGSQHDPAAQPQKAAAAGSARPLQLIGKYKWLIAATVLIAITGLFAEFASSNKNAVARHNSDVQVVDLNQMPDGALLKAARTRRGIMICLVSDQWAQLSADQRREKIKAWQAFGRTRGIETITLIDSRGISVGSAYQDKITIDNT